MPSERDLFANFDRMRREIDELFGDVFERGALGADVVAEEAKASYEDGILRVEIPLARADQSVRRVPIEEGGPE